MSDVDCGAVLLQDDNKIDHSVSYCSYKFSTHQINYSICEKEILALILALQYFHAYLDAPTTDVLVYTDHNLLVFINRRRDKNHRLLRWSLVLQGSVTP